MPFRWPSVTRASLPGSRWERTPMCTTLNLRTSYDWIRVEHGFEEEWMSQLWGVVMNGAPDTLASVDNKCSRKILYSLWLMTDSLEEDMPFHLFFPDGDDATAEFWQLMCDSAIVLNEKLVVQLWKEFLSVVFGFRFGWCQSLTNDFAWVLYLIERWTIEVSQKSWNEEVIGYPAQLNLQNIEIDRRSVEAVKERVRRSLKRAWNCEEIQVSQ